MPYKDPEKAKEAKKKWDKEHRVGKRHQVWLAIFYEEDCPSWEQELTELCITCLVSPLHDRDKWTAHDEKKYPGKDIKAGHFKKPHRHLIADYGTNHGADFETFKKDFAFLGKDGSGPARCKFAKSRASSTAYLCHLTPDCERAGKVKYDPSLVLEFCGANYRDWLSAIEDLHQTMKEMRSFIRENSFTEFADFQDWCDEFNDEWSRALDLKCAWAIGNYIDRDRNKQEAVARMRESSRVNAAGGDHGAEGSA